MMVLFHVAVMGALLATTLQALLNLRTLPRLVPQRTRPARAARPRVSVLIPARNEGARVGRCLDAWRGELGPGTELVLLDDGSTDDTRPHAAGALARVPGARLLNGAPLPAGWAGKAHACHQLARAARGDLLVFADVDVEPRPGALGALVAALAEPGTDAVTVLPHHTATSPLGRHLAPLQSWVLASFCPLWLVRGRAAPLLAATNGQLLALRRAAYDGAGGYGAVRASLAEDAALGRRLAAAGYRLRVVDGSHLFTCATYDTLREAWHGNVKNLFPVLFRSRALALAASLGLVMAWAAPWVLLAVALGKGGAALGLGALETLLGLVGRAVVARGFGYSLGRLWSHPLLALLLAAMILGSAWAHHRGHVRWRGRDYSPGRDTPVADVPLPPPRRALT